MHARTARCETTHRLHIPPQPATQLHFVCWTSWRCPYRIIQKCNGVTLWMAALFGCVDLSQILSLELEDGAGSDMWYLFE